MLARLDAYEAIRRDALLAIEQRRLQPAAQLVEVRSEIERAVDSYQQRARTGDERPLSDRDEMVERVLRSVTELGPLSELLARRDVEEVFIEGARVTYLDVTGHLCGLAEPTSELENRLVVDRLLAATERQLNVKHPLVQARVLGESARLTAAIPPIADQLSATVRRYTVRDVSLDALVGREMLTGGAAAFLWAVMQLRSRVVISGEPGAGKTTLAAALLATVPPDHCVRVCEEIRELAVPLAHGAYYEVRPPGVDGDGEISLRALVKFLLAMRPDRIVVGEVRGAEAFELTRAVNAGCGFLCTVHANRAQDATRALVNAALMAGRNVTEPVVRRVFADALDVVVHVNREHGARRRVVEISAVDDERCAPVFSLPASGDALEWTGNIPAPLEGRIDRALRDRQHVRALIERGAIPA